MKFCPNCGAELADDSVFCGACGTKLAEDGAAEGTTEVAKKAPKIDKKILAIGIGALAVIAIIVVLICVLVSGGGYKGKIKKYFNFFNDKHTNNFELNELTLAPAEYDLYKCMYDVLVKPCKDDADDVADFLGSEFSTCEEYFEDLYDDYEDDYGKNWKITYEIKKEKKISKDDLEDFQDEFQESGDDLLDGIDDFDDFEDEIEDIIDIIEDECDVKISKSDIKKIYNTAKDAAKKLSKTKIKEGYNVTVKYVIEGKEDKDKGEVVFQVLNIDGDWILYGADHELDF